MLQEELDYMKNIESLHLVNQTNSKLLVVPQKASLTDIPTRYKVAQLITSACQKYTTFLPQVYHIIPDDALSFLRPLQYAIHCEIKSVHIA